MCRTEGSGSDNGRMTQIIVPKNTPGLRIVRGIEVWGRHSDHCEVVYDDVRVPLENQLGRAGSGHEAAQERLGAGRVYHCMNSIGQMWRAFDLMVERATMREVHGGKLESKQFVQGFIADSYIDIQAARLMTIHCAEKMDGGGDPRTDISAIKLFVPAAYERVVDRAIPGLGCGRRVGRPAARRDVPGRAHAAHRRRAGRGAPDPDREERAVPLPRGRELGLRELIQTRGHDAPRPNGRSPSGPHSPRSLRSAARLCRAEARFTLGARLQTSRYVEQPPSTRTSAPVCRAWSRAERSR